MQRDKIISIFMNGLLQFPLCTDYFEYNYFYSPANHIGRRREKERYILLANNNDKEYSKFYLASN